MNFPKPKYPTQRERRRATLREYTRKRRAFLETHRDCEVGMTCEHTVDSLDGEPVVRRAPAVEVHHRRGRGEYLLDEDTWTATCRDCHRWIEENVARAYELGFLEKRVAFRR